MDQALRGEDDEENASTPISWANSWPNGWLLARGSVNDIGGSKLAMKINTQIPLAFLLIALIPLATIGLLSYFDARDIPNLGSQRPGTGRQNMGGERAW